MVRRFIASLCLLAALAGCSGGAAGGRHRWTQPGELRWSDAEDVDNLNPLLSTETLVNDLSAFTMGYFFVFDDQGNVVPSLCLTVPSKENGLISKDGKRLTFKLRHGVVWHDGAPFTSDDVAFTVKTILDPKTNVLTRTGWDQIERVETPDKYTAVFVLKAPFAAFVNRFFTPVGNPAILPKHILAGTDVNRAPYNALPVGLGPFKYVKWARGNEIVMEAFPRWWGGKPKLNRVVFRVIPDANTALTQLRSHEIDLYVRVPNNKYEEAAQTPQTRSVDSDSASYGHLDFNLANPVLADVRVREALARAVDRRELWDKVDHRSGFLACTPVPRRSWAYDAKAPCYDFDLKKASSLLDAAGWTRGSDGLRHKNGQTLSLNFAGNTGNPGLDSRVLLIQGWFKQIGVALDYKRYPTNQLFAAYAAGGIVATRHYDLSSYAWSLPPDPDISNLVACSRISPAGQNYMAYCNREVDRRLDDALTHYEQPRRKADYIAVQEMLGRDVPFVVLSQRTDHDTFNDDLKGLKPGPYMLFWNPQELSI